MTDEMYEAEFTEAVGSPYGFDGYHVEDVVGFALMFRRQRDLARAELKALKAEIEMRKSMTKAAFDEYHRTHLL